MEKLVTVEYRDFQSLVISQVRYSLGRMTMMPFLTSGIIKEHIEDLSKNTMKVSKGTPVIGLQKWVQQIIM
ncbi:hypothetical protein [Riemerella columbina]|uniref:hypothetical protein n=1 Tax=Riemerella columbina TaxID=103810 RepID=UPI0003688F97|nr:hypothetical protein [Riemerella columbina]